MTMIIFLNLVYDKKVQKALIIWGIFVCKFPCEVIKEYVTLFCPIFDPSCDVTFLFSKKSLVVLLREKK